MAGFRFDRFLLDPADRRLAMDGEPVELNARYLDALALLVREAGRLVSKDRFLDEVWRGVPVTDEALTQCIKTLRRQLGDDAASPRFIETVPKHGYRFIAPVEPVGERGTSVTAAPSSAWRRFFLIGGAGTVGGAAAGFLGGLFYGFAGASQPLQPAMGAASVLLVLVVLTVLVAMVGAVGVSFGIAAAGLAARPPWYWTMLGGALGGMIVGALGKLLGLDAFLLMVGRSPGDITGAIEGAVLGGAVGLAAWLVPGLPWRRAIAAAAMAGATAGLLIPSFGGRLLGGSLDELARNLPGSRFRLDHIGALLGERGFGPLSQAISGAMEGALFAACIVGAMLVAQRGPPGPE